MSSFKKYNLARVDGVQHAMPFVFPGEGDTGEKIYIRSQHCSQFREADTKASRQLSSLRIANAGVPLQPDVVDDILSRVFCSLIAGWTFEEECNEENILDFLKANPQTKDEIDHLAAKDSLFFKKEETI